MIKITKKDAVRLLRAVVYAKGPGYVDPHSVGGACKYVREEQPSCIAGHVLHAAGVPVETLIDLDSRAVSTIGSGSTAWLAERDIVLTPGAVAALRAAQREQDHSFTWGEALTAAVKAAR